MTEEQGQRIIELLTDIQKRLERAEWRAYNKGMPYDAVKGRWPHEWEVREES